jgi:hypothetical protein
MRYGARHLKRAIEKHIVYPLANLLATGQLRLGDVLCIDWDEQEQRLVFEKEAEGVVLPVPAAPAAALSVQAAHATDGIPAEEPTTVGARETTVAAALPIGPSARCDRNL